MKHSLRAPEIDELEGLIALACDGIPGPDPVRMQTIRDGLILASARTRSHKSMNKVPWWAVLLLTGGLATAAWWTGQQWRGGDQSDNSQVETKSMNRLPETRKQFVSPATPIDQVTPAEESPVIYQREAR